MVSPWAVPPLDYDGNLYSNEELGMRNEGAAHKNQKRRGGLKLAIFSYRQPNP